MAEEATHQLSRRVVAKLCQTLGWQSMQNGACDVLADLLKRYVTSLGRTTAAYVANANRTDAVLDDVARAFDEMGVSIDDLFSYTRLVDSAPFPSLPNFPLPRNSAHIYSAPPTTPITRPRPSISEEDEGEEDVIPPYLPPLPSKKVDADEDDAESGVHDAVEMEKESSLELSETLLTSDPQRGLPQMFRSRSRLSSEMSEEGGEGGGSRRGSFSEGPVPVPNRGVWEPAPVSTLAMALASGGNTTTKIIESSTNPAAETSHPVHGSTDSTQFTESTRQFTESGERETTPLLKKESSLSAVLPPATSPSDKPTPGNGRGHIDRESERENSGDMTTSFSSSRPPPLQLMPSGDLPDLHPITSPHLTSPHLTSPHLTSPHVTSPHLTSPHLTSPHLTSPVEDEIIPSLPVLSPLSATPTQPHPPRTEPVTMATTVSMATPSQLMPTTTNTEQTVSPVEKIPGSEDEIAPSHTQHQLPPSPSLSPGVTKPRPLTPPTNRSDPPSNDVTQDTEETVETRPLLPERDIQWKKESLSDIDTPSPEAVEPRPQQATPTDTAHSPPTLEEPAKGSPSKEEEEEEEEEEEVDNESVLSATSSTKDSPYFTEPPEKQETETGFELVSPVEGGVTDREVRLRAREVAVADINTEGGGEGGVACILDEGEMDLADIDQQLQLTESEDSSSSDSSSGSEVDVPGSPTFLEPPVSRFHSSHSVATTPSISPSPSPDPHSGTSRHSVPVPKSETLPTGPYFGVPLPVGQREMVQRSLSPSPTVGGPLMAPATPLVVSFKTELVASLRGRGRGREKVGSKWRRKKQSSSGGAAVSSEKKQKQRLSQQKAAASPLKKVDPPSLLPSLVIRIPRSFIHYELPGVTTSDLRAGFVDEEDDDDIIVTHSSAEQVKFNPSLERVKTDAASSVSFSQQGFQYSAPEGGTPSQGVWRRELDISEMGLVAPPVAPAPLVEPQVRVIPQTFSSSSSAESDTESDSSSHSSPSPPAHPHTLTHHTLSPSPSPWQQPIRSEDEESTSSSVIGGGGKGLKLKLKISKSLLQTKPLVPQLPGKPDKKHRKRASAAVSVSMATTSCGGRGSQKRSRSSKSAKSGRKSGSNIPQIKLPKLELSALPGAPSSWQQTTPPSGRGGLFPPVKLPGVAVSPGGEVWYCPQCTKPDDGSPMIGCDGNCEGWYHWYCVGITEAPPENERWFCPSCAPTRGKKKRKRRK